MNRCGKICAWTLLLILAYGIPVMALDAGNLQCEYRTNPLGLDIAQPRLSWQLESPERMQGQSAYRVLVASTPENLAANTGDLWDSGMRVSSETAQIAYAGSALKSNQACYWKVRVWNQSGATSAWSSPAFWSMGLLSEEDWKAQWIGMPESAGNPDFPWLRKTVDVPEAVARAYAHVNSLGYYELYVNGKKVDDHVLSPAVTQMSVRSFVITHDITAYLRPGKNVFALWLGHGWYADNMFWSEFPGPVARMQMDAALANGTPLQFVTNATWKTHESPIAQVDGWMEGGYGGERFDARNRNTPWNQASFDDSPWPQAVACDVRPHAASAQPVEPNRIMESFRPIAIEEYEPGVWLVDFGRNFSGWIEAAIPGQYNDGDEVVFRYVDHLCEKEEFKHFHQRDEYVAKEGNGQYFKNRFNYHAFRYAHITGLTAPPTLDDFQAHLIHTDYKTTGSFASSSDRLNRIHDMVAYTIRCLSLGGYIVDCPHRERLGYGGDGLSSTETVHALFGMAPLYTAWLTHWSDVQRPNGDMPHTAPNPCNAGGGPYWCGFIIHAAWEMYLQYGDIRVLEEHYPTMQRWLEFAEKHVKDGILRPWPNEEYRNWYLGDWATPKGVEPKDPASIDLINNCFLISCYDQMARIARSLGHFDQAQKYQATADARRPVVHQTFYDADKGIYCDGDQLELAYPLLTNVCPESLRPNLLDKLTGDILGRGGRHTVGLVGVPILERALAAYGRDDVVLAYTDHDEYPGYGYMLANGGTTVWEYWDKCDSNIHNCYNGIGAWFYRSLAGIRPDPDAPGYEKMIIAPQMLDGLQWVRAEQNTMRGNVAVHWEKSADTTKLNIVIPPGATATIYLPIQPDARISEDGRPIDGRDDVRLVRIVNGIARLEVGSGSYQIASRSPQS
jgi:alpha-L-rhamnosidase